MIFLHTCSNTEPDHQLLIEEMNNQIRRTSVEISLLNEALVCANDLEDSTKNLRKVIVDSLSGTKSCQNLRNWLLHESTKLNKQMQQAWATSDPSTFASWQYLQKAQAEFYWTLSSQFAQCGIDDLVSPNFLRLREQEAEAVLRMNSSSAARDYLRYGCPLGYRAQLWSLHLNAQVTEEDRTYYEKLKLSVVVDEFMIDQLICKEVQLTASNDDMHFVFCDFTYQVLLPFTRDVSVLKHFQTNLANPPRATDKNGHSSNIYPPSGVIPFHGFSMYVLPLCYLYDDPVTLYIIFRELYLRYFHKLHTISNDEDGIVGLCVLFERLLQVKEPQVFYHLQSCEIQPIRFVFKWLMRAFSGFLAPDQVLLLWDRILGNNSLEILAVLAVAIFSYRKANLLVVNTAAAVEAILADLTPLCVASLLQCVLFVDRI